jgi:hypothetical protein
MNTKLFMTLALSAIVSLNTVSAREQRAHDVTELDMEVFSHLKDELQTAKKVFEEIRDSQNPGILKSAVGSFGGLMKELAYISTALFLVGGVGYAGCFAVNLNPSDLLSNNYGIAALIATAAILGLPVILTYAFLKLLFGRLLATSDKDVKSIKESLGHIELVINKLDYEIKKVENLIRLQKASQTQVR